MHEIETKKRRNSEQFEFYVRNSNENSALLDVILSFDHRPSENDNHSVDEFVLETKLPHMAAM